MRDEGDDAVKEIPMGSTKGRCRACEATILWAVTVTGKRMPLDPRPNAEGNVFFAEPALQEALAEAGVEGPSTILAGKVGVVGTAAKARMVAARERNGMEPIEFFISHFATCPDRRKFLKR